MPKLIQCIPNFSEGRNKETLNKLIKAANSSPGITLVDYSSDKNHNRSVFTLIGSPENMEKVILNLFEVAISNINMNNHLGEHPRMGAVDVIPFVPIKNISMEECVKFSRNISKIINDKFSIPVFLYEESAINKNRTNLSKIRSGEFEKMPSKLLLKEWKPDYGEKQIHPTAGVVAIGARMPLIAFNVNLDTNDLKIANNIAKTIRGSSGGFQYCKAIGVKLEDQNIVQVSMNITNYNKAPLYRIFETIKMEAKRYNTNILESEIIGITSFEAITNSALYYLQLNNFDSENQILENHL